MKNYININREEQNKAIYRVFSVDRLLKLFEKKENVLVKPKLWDDPFENFMMNSTVSLIVEECFQLVSEITFMVSVGR